MSSRYCSVVDNIILQSVKMTNLLYKVFTLQTNDNGNSNSPCTLYETFSIYEITMCNVLSFEIDVLSEQIEQYTEIWL